MEAKHHFRALPQTPDLSMSDSEDEYSSSEEEIPDREEVDRMLRQAHHYVITEGGNDSPSTYIQRINRINRDLIQEIPQHRYDCDSKLYRRVKQKIDHVLREFEDNVNGEYDDDEVSQLGVVAEKPLYHVGSSPVTPGRSSITRTTERNDSKNDSERTYLYGGPHNYPEVWYRNTPASLPFPETFRMADWENLRIHWDLATTGKVTNTKPVTSTGVAFNNPRLVHYDNLGQFESGSRFKLPTIDPVDMAKVTAYGTTHQLCKAVDEFARNDDSLDADNKFRYTPRLFVDRLRMNHQASPVGCK